LVPHWHSAKIRGLTNDQQKLAEANFKELGPIPRICIKFVRDQNLLRIYKKRCEVTIKRITYDSLRRFVLDGADLDLDVASHVFLIRRNEVEVLEDAYLEPISANVEMQLMRTIDELQWLERIDLYHTFASLDATKAVAGLMFESIGHTLLQRGTTTLTLKPMIMSQKRTLFHWKSQGEEQVPNSVNDSEISEFFPPNPAIIYEGRLTSVVPNCLHVPKARNQVALDSFVQVDPIFYIFQFTVAKNHDIKIGIKDYLSGLQEILPPKTDWRFVFITPPGCEVDVNATSEVKEFLEGVRLYSAHMEVKQRSYWLRRLHPKEKYREEKDAIDVE
jgi:hypothetical protein